MRVRGLAGSPRHRLRQLFEAHVPCLRFAPSTTRARPGSPCRRAACHQTAPGRHPPRSQPDSDGEASGFKAEFPSTAVIGSGTPRPEPRATRPGTRAAAAPGDGQGAQAACHAGSCRRRALITLASAPESAGTEDVHICSHSSGGLNKRRLSKGACGGQEWYIFMLHGMGQ